MREVIGMRTDVVVELSSGHWEFVLAGDAVTKPQKTVKQYYKFSRVELWELLCNKVCTCAALKWFSDAVCHIAFKWFLMPCALCFITTSGAKLFIKLRCDIDWSFKIKAT